MPTTAGEQPVALAQAATPGSESKTEFADNHEVSALAPLESRGDVFNGDPVPVWHTPDHLTFSNSDLAFAMPRYTAEHVVELAGVRVPTDKMFDQGEQHVVLHGKETVVTDWWTTKYKSGWRGYIGMNSHRPVINRGDRERDEFFEPTTEQ